MLAHSPLSHCCENMAVRVRLNHLVNVLGLSVSLRVALDIRGRMPSAAVKAVQVSEANLEPRSEMMSRGRPRSLHISFAKIRARSLAVLPPVDSRMKCAIFVNRSIITQSSVQPIDTSRPGVSITGRSRRGYGGPAGDAPGGTCWS